MGLVFLVIIQPILICAACFAVGIFLVFVLTSKIKDNDMKNAARGILVVCVIALAVYALSKGLFSPTLPAWH